MPVAEFNDVLVMPIQKLVMGKDMKGGPIWPNWAQRSFERHCRNGKPMDTMPTLLGSPARMTISPAFWGGFVTHHFGHQIADFLMRILPSRLMEPDARVLFSAQGPEPRWFREVLNWMDVPAGNVHIIREPAWLPRLAVVHQPEQLWNGGPSQDHLDAMDRFIAQKLPPSERITTPIYVSRAGLALSQARFAGEAYLEHCLRQAGVCILRPETESVEHQIRTYLAADHLIFSEGSSLHLLQLAGRNFCRVDVLGRRDWDMMKTWVQPRSRSYQHLCAARATIHGLTSFGDNAHHPTMVRKSRRPNNLLETRSVSLPPDQVAATLDQAKLPSLAESVRDAIVSEGSKTLYRA